MKIVIVSAFYSEGMGYTENCLPKALASLGHEVHLVASNLNVYGNSADYDRIYKSFLGPADQGVLSKMIDGYTLHRLDSGLVAGYVRIRNLAAKVREIRPDVVHCTEIASLQSFLLAAIRPFLGFKFFAETHQHLSVIKPFLKQSGFRVRKAAYWATRTLPTSMASLSVEKCYAIAPDCVEVATRFYGVPVAKTKLQSLGTDTELFRPATSPEALARRTSMRLERGYSERDIVCVYTGRFSQDKNPLLLARAVETLSQRNPAFQTLFVGEGGQKEDIMRCRNARVLPFMRHTDLAEIYRLADVAVWPRQESMSMLDAAASALPLVVADTMGESERIAGNGLTYADNSVEDLIRALEQLASRQQREALGQHGRAKMVRGFSWTSIGRSIAADYVAAGVVSRPTSHSIDR